MRQVLWRRHARARLLIRVVKSRECILSILDPISASRLDIRGLRGLPSLVLGHGGRPLQRLVCDGKNLLRPFLATLC